MASYHFRIKTSSKTKTSANMRADYINREGKFSEGTKAEELLYKVSGNMPEWAIDNPRLFWETSELYEKAAGRTSFREIIFALPNELNFMQQKQLVDEFIVKHFGDQFVYSYAIHEKTAALANGVKNPHVHIMFCERRLDGLERSQEIFFKRADSKQPERGGAFKDARWNGSDRSGYLLFMREDCAKMQNKYLEREGFTERVDHRQKEVMFFDAVTNGDLNRAELLEAPAEKHLGPKIASRVSRDLSALTAGVSDSKERGRIRAEYWKAREEANELKVSLLRESRILKESIYQRNDKQFLQQGNYRVAHAASVAVNMFWKSKSVELYRLRSQLDLEKYRLERAEKNPNTKSKVIAWRSYYDKRQEEFSALTDKVSKRLLTSEDKLEVDKIKDSIIAVESTKKNVQEKISVERIVNELYPGVTKRQLINIANQRYTDINQSLKELFSDEKMVSKKIRSTVQIRLIAEWRVSRGLLSSISRDKKLLMNQSRKYKIAYKEFNHKEVPPPSSPDAWKYELELPRFHGWQDGIYALKNSIEARKIGWDIQKTTPETKSMIDAFVDKFEHRNKVLEDRLINLNDKKQALYQERSEWHKLGYSLNRPEQSGRFLQESRSIHAQFQKALHHLREARPKGRMNVKLSMKDDEERANMYASGREAES